VVEPVGAETICHSSNSSMDGNVCENSVRYDEDVCGEEEGDEVGEGGPRLERGTKACACGEGAVELDADADDVGAREERLELE